MGQSNPARIEGPLYDFGPFRLDAHKRLLTRNGQRVPLGEKTFGVLLALVCKAGQVIDRGELLSAVWADSFVEDDNITHHISVLRKILAESGAAQAQGIQTIKGRGYKFLMPVREIRPEPVITNTGPGQLASAVVNLVRGGFPLYLTSWVGRQNELTALMDLIQRGDIRLLSVCGPPGCGKTRISVELAKQAVEGFPDGVWFVSLATVTASDMVGTAIRQALNIPEKPDKSTLELLKEHLEHKRALIVLDNFEHVLPASLIVRDLVSQCPALKVLVTSRAVLKLYGEQEFHLEPLPLPAAKQAPTLDSVLASPAVTLFVQRARAVKNEFALTESNAGQIAAICRRLDGLPLAIELAAARLRAFNPATLLGLLQKRFRLLSDGARDLPVRQQTLRTAIEWSYSLFDVGEQALFRCLSVFVGGFSLEAVEWLGSRYLDETTDVIAPLSMLVEKNMVLQEQSETEPGARRFGMLETIREFGMEMSTDNGEMARVRELHAEYFTALAERAEESMDGPGLRAGMSLLESEIGNLRAALTWANETGAYSTGLRIVIALRRFWSRHGSREASAWLGSLLRENEAIPPEVLAKAFGIAGYAARLQGDYEFAISMIERGLVVARKNGQLQEEVVLMRQLAAAFTMQRQLQTARDILRDALARLQIADNRWLAASINNDFGAAFFLAGDFDAAIDHLQLSIQIYSDLGYEWGTVTALNNLALSLMGNGKLKESSRSFCRGLTLAAGSGTNEHVVNFLENIGLLALKVGDAASLVLLMCATENARAQAQSPVPRAHEAEYRSAIDRATALLQPENLHAARAAGQDMSLEQAVDYALRLTGSLAEESAEGKIEDGTESQPGRLEG